MLAISVLFCYVDMLKNGKPSFVFPRSHKPQACLPSLQGIQADQKIILLHADGTAHNVNLPIRYVYYLKRPCFARLVACNWWNTSIITSCSCAGISQIGRSPQKPLLLGRRSALNSQAFPAGLPLEWWRPSQSSPTALSWTWTLMATTSASSETWVPNTSTSQQVLASCPMVSYNSVSSPWPSSNCFQKVSAGCSNRLKQQTRWCSRDDKLTAHHFQTLLKKVSPIESSYPIALHSTLAYAGNFEEPSMNAISEENIMPWDMWGRHLAEEQPQPV